MAKYSELLKDPRWQKKRLEVLSRDEWKCKSCGSSHITLHVHHKEYAKGKPPWDYPDDVLITLCETCHYFEEDLKSFTPYGIIAKLSGILNIKLWVRCSAMCYMQKKHPEKFKEITKIIDSECFPGGVVSPEYSEFLTHVSNSTE